MAGMLAFMLACAANAALLPAYRATRPARQSAAAGPSVWRDRAFLALVLSYSGYYILMVQMLMLLPLSLQQQTGSASAAGWLYAEQTAMMLLLAYPLTRYLERRWSRERCICGGLALITLSLLLIPLWHSAIATLSCAALFMLGALAVEPAREGQLMSLAKPHARARYIGAGRLGQAIGGASGYLIGGALADLAHTLSAPSLPWLALGAIGALTLLRLRTVFKPQLLGPSESSATALSRI
ncbi:MFS transporter [Chromobacterium sp. IIBBL 290-4]|uniref:MFS transporter n=1 Tax=Chromobacterium sp. IIBBL 290-4 TaxID=2953890 RepID=UPI0020B65BAC|nr:MFS transporter [Chromobacterium sp. IIBBL 290-4]UTH72429.1 MFS transporter [Chromobacterium sp. IIBBL 290-4]